MLLSDLVFMNVFIATLLSFDADIVKDKGQVDYYNYR